MTSRRIAITAASLPWHFLNFFPLLHGHGLFRLFTLGLRWVASSVVMWLHKRVLGGCQAANVKFSVRLVVFCDIGVGLYRCSTLARQWWGVPGVVSLPTCLPAYLPLCLSASLPLCLSASLPLSTTPPHLPLGSRSYLNYQQSVKYKVAFR